ncbi:MAG TPA: class F sortase [Acidimicrobiales bacterium]
MAESIPMVAITHLRGAVREWVYWTIAIIALGAGALMLWAPRSATQTPAVQVLSIAPSQPASSVPTFLNVPRSRPVALSIPSIGVDTSVGELGLQADGEVEVPTTTRVVGWYRYGVTPGQVGSAVILGHVDSYLGPGVFFDLKTVKAGDSLDLTLADGARARFVVTEVVQYLKTAFPDPLVYGAHGTSRSLQLVTCGGVFDHATGHYLSNVVVYSHLERIVSPQHS